MAESLQELRDAKRANIVKGTVLRPRPEQSGPVQHPGDVDPHRCYLRQEIDCFIEDEVVCNLFLLALLEMQGWDPSSGKNTGRADDDLWSWFQIAGIHGKPTFEHPRIGKVPWADLTEATAIAFRQINDHVNSGSEDTGDYSNNQGLPRDGTAEAGYCSHSSILFPTWHRPYMTMMEQAVFLKMDDIALRYPVHDSHGRECRSRYINAAQRFRFPYWDPYRPRMLHESSGTNPRTWQCGVPKIFMTKFVNVRTPQDPLKDTPRKNPLYNYTFTKDKFKFDDNQPFYYARQQSEFWPTKKDLALKKQKIDLYPSEATIRCPGPNGISDHVSMNAHFHGTVAPGVTLWATGAKLYDLLSQVGRSYNAFSNTQFYKNPRAPFEVPDREEIKANTRAGATSIEGWHNDIHGWCGWPAPKRIASHIALKGHMGDNQLSSFDPIFFLHHMNMDRIFAMWQKLNPDTWITTQYLVQPTFTQPTGFKQDQETPLLPFLKTNNRFWTSEDCRVWTNLGYDYEEVVGLHQTKALSQMDQAEVRQQVNMLYHWIPTHTSPPTRQESGFPRDLSRVQSLRLLRQIDGNSAFWAPDFVDRPSNRAAPQNVAVQHAEHPAPQVINATPEITEEHVPHFIAKMTRASVPKETSTSRARVPMVVPKAMNFEHISHVTVQGKLRVWEAMATFEKFSIDGPFHLVFFLEDPTPRSEARSANDAPIGSIFNFTSGMSEGCTKCQQQKKISLIVSDTLDITQALIPLTKLPEKGGLPELRSLEPSDVVPLLQNRLHWRVYSNADREVPLAKIVSLTVSVAEREVTLPTVDTELPVYGEYTPWTEITHGKAGGVQNTTES